ncbi:MAG: hypothetical protein F6J94_24390 [Moorea sp. SIO1F2]|uniref:hypothetical protein n=1 Tax=Moorena sp. SIO1F2 TaxID=2607819 RepID=UPI0013B5D7A7|nr:hypothetical protein [Moorena sp. SIO1F2]NET84939.1 hypothetical protein [Moorena sp. SIO1F2]
MLISEVSTPVAHLTPHTSHTSHTPPTLPTLPTLLLLPFPQLLLVLFIDNHLISPWQIK